MSMTVTTKAFIAIGIRIFAIWLGLQILYNLVSFYIASMFDESVFDPASTSLIAQILAYGTYIFVSFLAVYLLYRASREVLDLADGETNFSIPIELQMFTFQLLGLYLGSSAIVYLPQNLFLMSFADSMDTEAGVVYLSIAAFVEIVVALSLIFFPRKWCHLFRRYRERA